MLNQMTKVRWLALVCTAGLWLLSTVRGMATDLNAVVTLTGSGNYSTHISTSAIDSGPAFLSHDGAVEDPKSADVTLGYGSVNYLHVHVGSLDFGSVWMGTFTLSDSNFVFPNGLQTISTDSVHWKYWTADFAGTVGSLVNFEDDGLNGTDPWGSFEEFGIAADARFLPIFTDEFVGFPRYSIPIFPVDADGTHGISIVRDSSNPTDELSQSGIYSVVDGANDDLGPSSVNRRVTLAYSDPGRVGARLLEAALAGHNNSIVSQAELFVDDIQFTHSGEATEAEVSLNLKLDGWLKGGAGSLNPAELESSDSGQAIVEVLVSINDSTEFTGRAEVTARYAKGANDVSEITSEQSGLLDGVLPDPITGKAGTGSVFDIEFGFPVEASLTTPPFTVDLNSDLSIKLELKALSTVSTEALVASSVVEFTKGFSFASEGPVFNLPEGVTADSVSGSIRDNVFEGPPLEPVEPEPDRIPVAGMFMQIDGIEGESVALDREGWIDLTGVSSGIDNSTRSLRATTPTPGSLMISKHIDAASPLLAKEVQLPSIDDVEIEINQIVSADLFSSFQYRLRDAVVSSYQIPGIQVGEPSSERVKIDYGYVEWIYKFVGLTGKSQGGVSAWWDVLNQTGGSAEFSEDNQPPSVDPVGNQAADPGSSGTVKIRVSDEESDVGDVTTTVSTSRPDLIGDLRITGTGAEREIHFVVTALRSGFAPITVTISDGTDVRTQSIPVLIDVEMTPFEGFLAAHFGEDKMHDPILGSPIQDPDKDGISTIVEFLLGTNPNEFNLSSEAMAVSISNEGGERTIKLDFQKRLDDPNIEGYFWGSFDMKEWTRLDSSNPIYEESGNQGENPLYEDTEGTVTLPPGTDPFFIRYQVTDVF